jgi:hypothetical protein
VGVPYSHTLTATATPPVRWALREGEGSLPPGLTLNASTGVISGTPTASGDFVSRVFASNEFFADVSEIVGISVAPHAGPPGPPPPPVAGQSVDARVVSGTVTAQCPGQPAGPLSGAQQLKVGCTIDSTNGRVAITSASDQQGHTQTADFYEGAFTVSQTTGLVPAKLTAAKKKKKKPKTVKALITVLTLKGPEPSGCGKKGKLVAASKRGRRLWGSGKGRFRTVGHRAHAIVRGTVWLTEERCNGTYVQVNQGVVSVQDLTLKKTVTVKAPHHYLAPAKKPKKKK